MKAEVKTIQGMYHTCFFKVQSDGIVVSVPLSGKMTMVQVLKLVQASGFYISHISLNLGTQTLIF